jgi:C1A family cysteine protease
MMIKNVFLFLTFFFTMGLLAENPTNFFMVRSDQANQTITYPQDQILVIELECNPSTGYSWLIKDLDRNVLQSVGEPEFKSINKKSGPGTPWLTQFKFIGISAGSTSLQLEYCRPWEKEKRPLKTLTYQIQTMGAYQGPMPTPSPIKEKRLTPAIYLQDPCNDRALPAHFNWAEQNGCTPVKDQGYTGTCWAFGAAAVVESQIRIKDGVVRDLSEQYIVSCNDTWYSGASGGFWSYQFYIDTHLPSESGAGAVYEMDFPYQEYDAPCNPPHPHNELMTSWGYIDGVPDDSTPYLDHPVTTQQIKQAIYDHGPIGTSVCSSTWSPYTGGIFTNDCTESTHIVCITGWDDAQGVFYIKNSWGTSWGENGYMRLKYNTCLVGKIATFAEYDVSGPRIQYGNFTGYQ